MLRVCGAWSAVAIRWVTKLGSGRTVVDFRDHRTVWVTGGDAANGRVEDFAVHHLF